MEGLFEVAEEIRQRIEKKKEAVILERLKEIERFDIIDIIENKKQIKFPPMTIHKHPDREEYWIDNNTDEGYLLVTFKLIWHESPYPELEII